ncbi:hypothetical protein [Gemmata massiliana]|nr:hypothetical protein [Gemmata massiliana]
MSNFPMEIRYLDNGQIKVILESDDVDIWRPFLVVQPAVEID